MDIHTYTLTLETKGHTHIYDITDSIQQQIGDSTMQEGQVCIFAIGSTTGITTLEYEPGLVNHDVAEMFEQFAPYGKFYHHNQTWGDDNGSSHLRSFLTGTSLNVPFTKGSPILGTWQQIVFVDFDTRPRSRKYVVQVMGV